MRILIKRGQELDILIEDGLIIRISSNITDKADEIINAEGYIILPGIFDMHVHLREPGREDKETVASGTSAALRGGVTSLLAMPNTIPAIDNLESINLLSRIIKETANTDVFIAAAITKGRLGKELVDMEALVKTGAVAFTDDGSSVDDEEVLRQAFVKAKSLNVPVICHCEDKILSNNGAVNLGIISTKLGLRGISRESEYLRVKRDIELAQNEGATIHIAHVSCKESVEIIAQAKKSGVKVTCETAPHYFSLSEEDLCSYDTNMKMNPPLRSKTDIEAIKNGLKDGTIDVIASDHAPHTQNEKDIEFDRAEFGVIGLQTLLSVSISELVVPGVLSWEQLAQKLCYNPFKIINKPKRGIEEGSVADLVIVDPGAEWKVDKKDLVSKSKNSSFLGKTLKGVVKYVFCNGELKYKG